MDTAVLGRAEVIDAFLSWWEINGHSTSFNEGHTTFLVFFFGIGTAEDLLLIWIRLSFERFQFDHVKTSLHGPLNDTAITCYRDKSLRLCVSVNPLNFPNNIRMFIVEVFGARDWCVIFGANIENGNVSLTIADRNQMRILL